MACYKSVMNDRKYRHRGYQDDGAPREPRREAPPQAPRERPEGPRGRGLGAPTESVFRCQICGAKQRVASASGFDATCDHCAADLHTCTNCSSFDTSCPSECRKPVLQRVASKSRRNQCEAWSPKAVQEFAQEAPSPQANPHAAFDDLFRKR